MDIKDLVRSVLNALHLDVTKNLEYDRLTKKIMHRVIRRDSNCIDIGCHKGEILNVILKLAPEGEHFGFEPIPYLYAQLKKDFAGKATIFPYALAEKNGKTSFQLVKNAPAYSGIRKRRYDIATPDIEEIEVEMRMLDELIPPEIKIDFIKIDVEGGEFGVLKGAKKLLKKSRPVIVFEFGKGASDYYGTTPADMYAFLTKEIGLNISTLKAFLSNKTPLSLAEFEELFNTNREYYFIAHTRDE